jgi:hypothetical protein
LTQRQDQASHEPPQAHSVQTHREKTPNASHESQHLCLRHCGHAR